MLKRGNKGKLDLKGGTFSNDIGSQITLADYELNEEIKLK